MATEEMMVIGIAGGTGSGKTTLTNRLKERFGDEVTVIYHDNYYKRHDELTYEERCLLNYDHPDAFDTDLMMEHIRGLRAGRAFSVLFMTLRCITVLTELLKSILQRCSSSKGF